MQLLVAAVGQRMPRWVSEAWQEYSRRMPRNLRLEWREIPLARRGDARQALAEGAQFLDRIGDAGGVGRAVDHEQPGLVGQGAAQLCRFLPLAPPGKELSQ